MNWPLIAAAGGGVVIVAALAVLGTARLRRRRRIRIDSAEDAAAAAERSLPAFLAAGAVLADDGTAALAMTVNGRVALVRQDGRNVAVREIGWRLLRSTPGGMIVETGDRRWGDVPLMGVDVLEVRRLLPEAARHIPHGTRR